MLSSLGNSIFLNYAKLAKLSKFCITQPQRPLHLTPAIEERLGKPIVAHDTALYWRVFKTLGLKPVGNHGHLLESL